MPTIYDLIRQIEAWRQKVIAELDAYDAGAWGLF